ncbi:MAG: dTMP kinase [Candidatus Cloacimonetes bacterium]|nr:dTMP kinase [Candidatus Cloacimonadota bacterium]
MKGLFITFEGIEGSGKSTQMVLLGQKLSERGLPILLSREPGGPPISEAIRSLLLDPQRGEMLPQTELLLYSASRAQHTGELILPALKEGRVVLCDRYYDSTFAYQGAARSQDMDFIRLLTAFATFNAVPDLTFLIDLPVSEGLARITSRQLDRLEQEDISFHEQVRAQYLDLARAHAGRFVVLDGSLSREAIHAQVLTHVLSHLGEPSE